MYLTISTAMGGLERKPILENLDALEKMPLRRFEIFGFPEHVDIRDPSAIKQLAQAGRSRGFSWESIHAPAWQGPYDLSSIDEDARRQAVGWNVAAIRAIGELGGRYCVTHAGDRIENPAERSARLSQSQRSFDELVQAAQREQIYIALENILTPYAPQCLGETEMLMEQTRSEWFRPIFDVGHAFLSDGLDTWYEAISKPDWNMIAVHVTDNHGRVRNTSDDDEHLFPFRGIIPWEQVFERIRRTGFDGPVTLECAIDKELFPKIEHLVCDTSHIS